MRVIPTTGPTPRPPPRPFPPPAAHRRPRTPSSSPADDCGRTRSDERPNTSRCNTANAAQTRSISTRSRAISAPAARRLPQLRASRSHHSFASSTGASATLNATSASEPGTTPAATATQHSKHPHQPQITHRTPACRRTRAHRGERPRHPTSEYLRSWSGQKELYSGKHKTTGMNVQVACTIYGKLAWISDAVDGSRHDNYCREESGVLLTMNPENWIGDKGYIGNNMITPYRKPAGGELLDWQKEYNAEVNKIRWMIEQAISHFKNWTIMHTDYRRPLKTFETAISAVVGLHFYRTA